MNIRPDKSITEVKTSLIFANDILYTLRFKSLDNPMNQNDYHELYKAIDMIESVANCRWTKEFY